MFKKFSIVLFIIIIFLFIPFEMKASTKEQIDMSNVIWDYDKPFIYDSTSKTITLKNVPNQITVSYSENTKANIGIYYATATFSYNKEIHELINYQESRYINFVWQISRGKYDTSLMQFNDMTVIEDGKTHSIEVKNLPEGLSVSYEGNGQSVPGIYEVTAKFTGNPYYEKVDKRTANLVIRRANLSSDNCSISSTDYGLDPNLHMKYVQLNLNDYSNLDLSTTGTYQEIKDAFALQLYDINDNMVVLDYSVNVTYNIPRNLLSNKDLKIYTCNNGRLASVESTRNGNTLIFRTNGVTDNYVVIGVKNTYTSNEIWKVFLMLAIIFIFIIGAFAGIKVYKRKRRFN